MNSIKKCSETHKSKSTVRPMNSSKNKMNSKISWFFKLKLNAH